MQVTPYVDGEVTSNTQVGFQAYKSSTSSNVTGSNVVYVITCDTAIYNHGSAYNTSNGIFTAPLTGVYQFDGAIRYGDIGASHGPSLQALGDIPNSRMILVNPASNSDTPSNNMSLSIGIIINMDAGDEIYFTGTVFGGSQTVDVIGGSSPYVTYFSGRLAT